MQRLFKAVANMDIRLFYLIITVVVTIPLVRPFGFPLNVSPMVREAYDIIETTVQEGDIVLVDVDFEPRRAAEMDPILTVMGKHIASKGGRMVLFTMEAGAFPYMDKFAKTMGSEFEMEYGKDIIGLPFAAGAEAAFSSFAQDIRGLYTVDMYGDPLQQLPLWSEITDASVAKMGLFVCPSNNGEFFIRQIGVPLNLTVLGGVASQQVSLMKTYHQSKQLNAMVVGTAGAAEYEFLTKFVGSAASQMDAQSLGHLLLIFFIVLGNIGYLLEKRTIKNGN